MVPRPNETERQIGEDIAINQALERLKDHVKKNKLDIKNLERLTEKICVTLTKVEESHWEVEEQFEFAQDIKGRVESLEQWMDDRIEKEKEDSKKIERLQNFVAMSVATIIVIQFFMFF